MKTKSEINISDDLVDEIVDEILSETSITKPAKKSKAANTWPNDDLLLEDNVSDPAKIKTRVENIENRVGKHIHDYEISAMEAERIIVEKFSEFEHENDKRLMYLQEQVESLRTAMIKLSNELRQLRASDSASK